MTQTAILSNVAFQFVLTAAGTEAEDVIDSRRKSWGGEPEKLQIFYVARRFS